MPALLRNSAIVLVIALALGACAGGGGQGGSTWLNLPSVPVHVDTSGSISVLGFPFPANVPQAMLEQLAEAEVDVLEVRIGHHGIFLHADGEPLPYLKWSDESTELLSEVLELIPAGEDGAEGLPLLRSIGLGVIVVLPTADGDIPRWRGEELVSTESAAETTIGPLQFASLAFDAEGNASIEGVPLAEIEQAMGASFGLQLPSTALDILSALGAQQFSLATQPNGIDLALGDTELPGLAYDTERLENLLPIIGAFVDPSTGGMVADVLSKLPGADLDIVVSFTGEPVADTMLPTIPVGVGEDGSLSAWGIPLGSGVLLPTMVQDILGDTNVQKLDLAIKETGLYLSLNQEPLPTITWTDSSLGTIGGILADLLGLSPGMVDAGLSVLGNLTAKTDIGLSLDVSGNDGISFAEEYDATAPAFAAPAEAGAPALQIGASIDRAGYVASALGITFAGMVGVPPIGLPPVVMNIINAAGSDSLQLAASGSKLALVGDSEALLTLDYDAAALNRLIVVVASLSESVAFIDTIDEYLAHLPPVIASGLDVQLALAGQPAPESRLTSLPLEVKADGALSLMGIPLGDALVFPPDLLLSLQERNIQRLDLNVIDGSLYLAANGESLPVVSWTDRTMAALGPIASGLLPIPGIFDLLAELLKTTDIGVALAVPAANGAEPVSMPASFDPTSVRMEPPGIELEHRPVLALGLTLEGSEILSVGSIPAHDLQEMGVGLPAIPDRVATILYDILQVERLVLTSTANQINVMADDEVLLSLHYDAGTILRALEFAAPFLSEDVGAALADPQFSTLFVEEFLPLIVGANLDVTAELVHE